MSTVGAVERNHFPAEWDAALFVGGMWRKVRGRGRESSQKVVLESWPEATSKLIGWWMVASAFNPPTYRLVTKLQSFVS